MKRICETALGPDEASVDPLALAQAALEAMEAYSSRSSKPVMQLSAPRPHIDRLLRSLITYLGIVPIDADALHDYSELPSDWLKNLVLAAGGAERSWRGWMDERLRIWLFIAELSLPLSRQVRAPVLHVDFYRENGLQDSADWSVDRDSKWHRCIIGAAPRAGRVRPSDEPSLTAIDFYRRGVAKR